MNRTKIFFLADSEQRNPAIKLPFMVSTSTHQHTQTVQSRVHPPNAFCKNKKYVSINQTKSLTVVLSLAVLALHTIHLLQCRQQPPSSHSLDLQFEHQFA